MAPPRTIALVLEYDGTDFCGWQLQPQGRTVQGELERALLVALREPVQVIGAGRTDAGTHALGQVAHFRTASDLPLDRLQRALNGLLPQDVAARGAAVVPADFHARFSARSKRYRYRIHRGKAAVARRQVWCVHAPLDAAAMAVAAAALPGTHACGAFCKQDPVPASLACRIAAATITHHGPEIWLEIEADRFLRHMVRIITGTLVEIGRGHRAPSDMPELLASGQRQQAGETAPALGLCLLWVRYPGFPELDQVQPG